MSIDPLEGWPEEPPYERSVFRRGGPLVPPDAREYGMVVHHHYGSPAPARRGPDPWTVLGWVAVAGAGSALVLAVAVAAVAIAASVAGLVVCAAVLYLLVSGSKGA